MIRVYTPTNIPPRISHTMHVDRTAQFRDRMGWPVDVNDLGEEWDQYDQPWCLYVVIEAPDGTHAGSMRLIRADMPLMVNEHFVHLLPDGKLIEGTDTYEVTRFCISPRLEMQAQKLIAQQLSLMTYVFANRFDVERYVAVFDRPMKIVYKRQGNMPEILGEADGICAGQWLRKSNSAIDVMAHRCNINIWRLEQALDASLKGY